jgi:adenosylcobinamide hydrolase
LSASELHTFGEAVLSDFESLPGAAPDPVPALAALAWRLDAPQLVASTAPVGGGIGLRDWVLNMQVPRDYARRDVDAHVHEVCAALGLRGPGVGMLTAAEVAAVASAEEAGVRVEATVGLTRPTWAAAPDEECDVAAGTINVVAFVPLRHTETVLCPATGPAEPFGGPRSVYGARVARAVDAALRARLAVR